MDLSNVKFSERPEIECLDNYKVTVVNPYHAIIRNNYTDYQGF